MKVFTEDELVFTLSLSNPVDASRTAPDWRNLPPPVGLPEDEEAEVNELVN